MWLRNSSQTAGLFLFGLCAFAILVHQPQRYINALLLSAVLFYYWNPNADFKRGLGLLFNISVLLSALIVNTDKLESIIDESRSQYECLSREIDSRGINIVALDYWTSKPLYYASKTRVKPIVIDYQLWEPFPWISPLNWGSGATKHFLQRLDCTGFDKHCNKEFVETHAKSNEEVCGKFSLYTLDSEYRFSGPQTKWESLQTNLVRNFNKVYKMYSNKVRQR